MKASEIRKMSIEEVRQHLQDAREEVWRLRFRTATEELENPLLLRHRRRDIARMMTMIREHERGVRRLAQSTPDTGEGTPS